MIQMCAFQVYFLAPTFIGMPDKSEVDCDFELGDHDGVVSGTCAVHDYFEVIGPRDIYALIFCSNLGRLVSTLDVGCF